MLQKNAEKFVRFEAPTNATHVMHNIKTSPMNKKKTAFYEMKLLIVIALCFMMTSGNGQANNGEKQNIIKEKETFQFPNFKNQISDVVRTMLQDSKGNIWFGTQNGAFKLTGDSLIHIDSIKSTSGKGVTIKDIAEAKDGKIWFGHTDGISSIDGTLVTNYYKSDGLISNDVWCIETDVTGNVWIETIKGVCIFDGQEFTNFDLPEGKKDTTVGISSTKMIHNILEDSKGTMWFCSNAGLFSYTNKKLKNISDEVGIPTNFVNRIVEDKNGGFWISTSIGLFHLNRSRLTNITAMHFKESKGTGSIIVDSKGETWFNCARSIYSLNAEKLTAYRITEGNYGPLTFHIYEDKQSRLWFVGYGGAYRYENGRFINIKQNGPW
jgi:ligand-binding sensor domain-containing protein